MENIFNVGPVIRKIVKRSGLTNKQFTTELGIAENYISSIYKYYNPFKDLYLKICDNLNTDPMEFIKLTFSDNSKAEIKYQRASGNSNILNDSEQCYSSNHKILEEENKMLREQIVFLKDQVKFYKSQIK